MRYLSHCIVGRKGWKDVALVIVSELQIQDVFNSLFTYAVFSLTLIKKVFISYVFAHQMIRKGADKPA